LLVTTTNLHPKNCCQRVVVPVNLMEALILRICTQSQRLWGVLWDTTLWVAL